VRIDLLRDAAGRPSAIRIRLGADRGAGVAAGDSRLWRQRGPAAADRDAIASGQPTVVIEARPDTMAATLRAMWRYRGFYGLLFNEMLMRRARGTLLGFWWVILRPLAAAAGFIFTFVFVAPLNTGNSVPYPVFFLSGFIPWRLFQGTVTQLPRSLMRTRAIMQRTYFPRLLVPLAGFGQALIEVGMLCVAFIIVAVALWWAHPDQPPLQLGWQTLWVVPCFIAALVFALSFGIVLSIVALFFRDIMFSASYVVQMVMFLTPVLYPVSFVPDRLRWLLYIVNPMAQIVIVSRWALTGQGEFQLPFILMSFATILACFAASVVFFLRAEVHLGDQM
jgi:lipopolysaccharide transport system permease protein